MAPLVLVFRRRRMLLSIMVRMSQRSYYIETRNTPEKYKEDLDVRPQRS